MPECRVDIIKNGYVYTDNFAVGVAPLIDSQGNDVTVKKQNLEFVLTSSTGINVATVIPSIGAFNIVTGVWTVPEISSDQKQYLSFMATVTDETLGPYEVTLTGTTGVNDDADLTNNSKVICLGGVTRGDILNEVSGLQGPAGANNVLTIGTITTGVASASITGTSPNQVLNLVLPNPLNGIDGVNGAAGDVISIGAVTTLAAGSAATATITGVSPNKVLNLGIPEGEDGNLSGGEVNVQSDWAENNSSLDTYILNKPTIPSAQVNSDFNATSGVQAILNKPTLTLTGGNVTGSINLETGVTSLTAENTQVNKETIQDYAAELFAHNGHTNITATHSDSTDEILLSVVGGLNTITDLSKSGDDLNVVGTGAAYNGLVSDVFKDTQNTYTIGLSGGNLTLSENGVAGSPIDISAHTHVIADVTGLQTALDSMQTELSELDIAASINVGGNGTQTNGNNIAITFQIANAAASATDRDIVFLTSLPDGFEYTSTGSSSSGITYDSSNELLTVSSGIAAGTFKALTINVDLDTRHAGAFGVGVIKRVKIQPIDSRGHETSLTAWNTQVVTVINP